MKYLKATMTPITVGGKPNRLKGDEVEISKEEFDALINEFCGDDADGECMKPAIFEYCKRDGGILQFSDDRVLWLKQEGGAG